MIKLIKDHRPYLHSNIDKYKLIKNNTNRDGFYNLHSNIDKYKPNYSNIRINSIEFTF